MMCHSSRSRVRRTALMRPTVDRCGLTALCESGPHPPAHRRHQCVVRGESHFKRLPCHTATAPGVMTRRSLFPL